MLGGCSPDDVEEAGVDAAQSLASDEAVEASEARAERRAAMSRLRAALVAAQILAVDHGGQFSDAPGDPIDEVSLKKQAPDINFVPSGSAAGDAVSVRVDSPNGPNSDIWLVTATRAGDFYCIHGRGNATTYGTGKSEDEAVGRCDSESW